MNGSESNGAPSGTAEAGAGLGNGAELGPSPGLFATTRWTMVLRARDASDSAGRAALEQLCRAYWRPLRAFASRSGFPIEDAEDFTQEFFLRLLARDGLAQVSPEKGRFRNFLLVSFRNSLADQRDKARAIKRGGPGRGQGGGSDGDRAAWSDGRPHFWRTGSSDGEVEEGFEAVHSITTTPEQAFERQWAHTVLQRARVRLRAECAASGRLAVYEALGPEDGTPPPGTSSLPDAPASGPGSGAGTGPELMMTGEESYEQIGARLGLGVPAVKSAAFRLRKRYRELIRAEVAETVEKVSEIDEELRHLLRVISE